MSEEREYGNEVLENGTIKISEEVIATIASLTVSEVEGVKAIAGGSDLLGKKTKGIRIKLGDGEVDVDVSVLVEYGFVVTDVAKLIQKNVSRAIESMAGMHVNAVNVQVTGVVFPDAAAKKEEENIL